MNKLLRESEVMSLIPNRYPIMYIDYVDLIDSGKRIVATKNLTFNEEFFTGNVLKNPVVPGTLIIEMLAQAGSILILKSEDFLGKTAYIGGINKAKFLREVFPGDSIKLHFEIKKIKGPVGTAFANANVNNQRVAVCEFIFIVGKKNG